MLEQHTQDDTTALLAQLEFRLQQLAFMPCCFCQEDFETLLRALDIVNREAVFLIGQTH